MRFIFLFIFIYFLNISQLSSSTESGDDVNILNISVSTSKPLTPIIVIIESRLDAET